MLGPLYTDKADPGTTNFVPRPDWFFYFLFYLLRIFKWPETVVLGTVGIPTMLLVLLIGAAVLSTGGPSARLLRRPVAFVAAILVVISMGVLTWKGATAKEALGSETVEPRARVGREAGLRRQRGRGRGRDAVRASRAASTATSISAPAAATSVRPTCPRTARRAEGSSGRSSTSRTPPQTPGSAMPSFAALGDENLTKIATFLEASKGPK